MISFPFYRTSTRCWGCLVPWDGDRDAALGADQALNDEGRLGSLLGALLIVPAKEVQWQYLSAMIFSTAFRTPSARVMPVFGTLVVFTFLPANTEAIPPCRDHPLRNRLPQFGCVQRCVLAPALCARRDRG